MADREPESRGDWRPGEVVRAARRHSGLTLAELGARTGYSAAQVSRYERGVTPLTDIGVLRLFTSALEIPPDAVRQRISEFAEFSAISRHKPHQKRISFPGSTSPARHAGQG
jgi:transcriptional regulator with XRE-family HTH domain